MYGNRSFLDSILMVVGIYFLITLFFRVFFNPSAEIRAAERGRYWLGVGDYWRPTVRYVVRPIITGYLLFGLLATQGQGGLSLGTICLLYYGLVVARAFRNRRYRPVR